MRSLLGNMENQPDVIAEARFTCAICDREAGHIQLAGSPSSSQLRRISFTSTLTAAITAEQFAALRRGWQRGHRSE